MPFGYKMVESVLWLAASTMLFIANIVSFIVLLRSGGKQ